MATAFGIDIGGSGIKGALVDLDKGEFIGERLRIPTPQPATPEDVARVCAQIIDEFEIGEDVPIGIDFPSPLPGGVVPWMANLDQGWVGHNAAELFGKHLGRPVSVINDADAAGLAEMRYGAGKNYEGVVFVVTLGTGIGTALFNDGVLVPNTELGHLEMNGEDAEWQAADSARKREDLSFKQWAKRLTQYFGMLQRLFSPSAFIIGGGISKKHDKFVPRIEVDTPIVPAELRNTAGIVGSAAYAYEQRNK